MLLIDNCTTEPFAQMFAGTAFPLIILIEITLPSVTSLSEFPAMLFAGAINRMSKMRAGRVAGKPLVSSSFDCNQKQGSVAGCKCSATLPLIHTVFNFEKDLLKPLFSPLSVLQEEPSLSLVDMNYGI